MFDSSKKLCHLVEQLFEGSKSGFTLLSAFEWVLFFECFFERSKNTQGTSEPFR